MKPAPPPALPNTTRAFNPPGGGRRSPPPRSSGGHRRYGPAALDRLRLIRSLRALDLPLPEVQRILAEDDGTGGQALEAAVAGQLPLDRLAAGACRPDRRTVVISRRRRGADARPPGPRSMPDPAHWPPAGQPRRHGLRGQRVPWGAPIS
ncbi:MerR family transcriptional regulator [Streptomyces sp. NPDC059991]|uniref:MerR family transcriptional regulator n=1 Tax=Streptomyces sp. NPDC059991 TaxID=3347028 RepID=UPI0036AD491A